MTQVIDDTKLAEAIQRVDEQKAGLLPPFLSRPELDDLLAAWWRLYNNPDIKLDNNRFIADHRLYQEPAFSALATHPVVQEVARRVIGDFKLASFSVVATPKNGDEPKPTEELTIHVDHSVYSSVPVPKARDTFVCIWVNFEDLELENGPFCIFTGTHAWNIGWEFFNSGLRPGLRPRDLLMHQLAEYNVGPAGSTAVYSGKTWHSGTVNCREELRKGLVINMVPAEPLDCSSQNFFDLCALPRDEYDALVALIGDPDYLMPHRPDLVGMTAADHQKRKTELKKANEDYDELA
jgi:hypothetical protein